MLGLGCLTVIAVVQETERMILMIAGAESEEKNNALPNENINLPPEVLALKPTVEKVAKEMSIPDEVPYLLAIIMVESGGRGGDPFQSSESAGLPPNTIVYQYVASMQQGINEGNGGNIQVLESIVGQSIYGGECYMLTAYYVEKLGGPQLRGSGFDYAERIGDDYNWSAYGWSVIFDPKPSDLRIGDIVNWYAGGVLTPQIYGHTGVISGVSNGGQAFTTYEQNSERGRVVAKYNRTFDITKIRSIVRKNK